MVFGCDPAVNLLCRANLSGSMAARAALLVPLAAASAVKIPQKTMAGANAVRLPMLVLGDGVSWGRPSNFTAWIELVGENAGIDTAWDYHSEKGIPGAVADAGARRSDVHHKQNPVLGLRRCGTHERDHGADVHGVESSAAQHDVRRPTPASPRA